MFSFTAESSRPRRCAPRPAASTPPATAAFRRLRSRTRSAPRLPETAGYIAGRAPALQALTLADWSAAPPPRTTRVASLIAQVRIAAPLPLASDPGCGRPMPSARSNRHSWAGLRRCRRYLASAFGCGSARQAGQADPDSPQRHDVPARRLAEAGIRSPVRRAADTVGGKPFHGTATPALADTATGGKPARAGAGRSPIPRIDAAVDAL